MCKEASHRDAGPNVEQAARSIMHAFLNAQEGAVLSCTAHKALAGILLGGLG